MEVIVCNEIRKNEVKGAKLCENKQLARPS